MQLHGVMLRRTKDRGADAAAEAADLAAGGCAGRHGRAEIRAVTGRSGSQRAGPGQPPPR